MKAFLKTAVQWVLWTKDKIRTLFFLVRVRGLGLKKTHLQYHCDLWVSFCSINVLTLNNTVNVKQHLEESVFEIKQQYLNLITTTTDCLKERRGVIAAPAALAPNTHISNWRWRGEQRGETEGRTALPAWGVWHVPSLGLLRTWGQSK